VDKLAHAVEANVADDDDVVCLTVPAEGGSLGVLRTATAGLAARLQYPLDRIEDLRIAVDEACAMLLVITPRDSLLQCRFAIGEAELVITISAPIRPGTSLPGPQSFPWQVLTSLTAEAKAEVADGVARIRMVTRLGK
jgi:serine/threonine-protein kinase RsbW